ncbi:MAG: sigma-54-dependent Fis family transcriptional regulator [Acidocella sp. 20-57-95]|nr:MAG: sigma-54-dependent Fis family transcriptional regulator [Acidocella sp. 20-57-95]OYV61344.1 MAG: sigma-54-dependent Fis family transcriptional regulator [Acidocella sp. 21-58-7]HQT64134.1 sigma-54 dependent transcriptional regulator [Acidocella sp.]HQU03093.1 sigma-54 dependent transcriptional regulator [Acidocella sp.]
MIDILIVDDEPDIRMLVEAILRDEGYEARSAGTSDEALAAYKARRPHLVILDVWLQGSKLDGIGILDVLHQEAPPVPVVMISGHGTIETAVAAIQRGAYDFIEKPFNSDRLLLVVRRALEAAKLVSENAELRLRVGPATGLTGEGQAIAALRAGIERVAPTGSRVLITGAPGAGKETVARMIHAKSRRAEGPFVALNCAILAPERFEIELFGVEASSSSPRRVGVLERAHGGTLLLDEVSDMPMETQGKIARVLQEQSFERVGGGGDGRVKVDIRVIASTAKDLTSEMAAGRFREDLYYRLAVVPLRVPSLKERREDIPALAADFLARAAETSGLPVRGLASDAIAALQAHDWPGNVRQLRNIMDWLMIMRGAETSDYFRAEHLPTELSAHAPRALAIDPAADVMALPLREARDVFETQYLQAQLLRYGGNISRTANFVGMERSALHRKLKQLGIGADEKVA